ncbi:thioredoxin domain-containing protein [Sphingomonas sp. BIUV-7]|uniref:Thioredoxin domain-containing protein n=1 Tax=Sphingomonas natans TaxID=3063330 RepID=A0ABT8YEV2_9SPHN|nr:thioredoxin domain-containing protein [Sphingomonas sp. BIUV-7]MDO6416873.1 thioredoxin domain-containing protein [Sphingomonas sp. BIUV-7]
MTFRRPATALLIALSLAACSKKGADSNTAPLPTGPVAAVAPPAGKDWTEVASMTPEGGVRMGNPDAAIKLVEYASLTCPHCAEFTKEGAEPIQAKFVKSGKVSWEYRPFVLNSYDIPAFLLTRCRGAEPFFKLAEQAYAAQPEWVGKAMALTPAQQTELQGTDQSQLFKKMASFMGLDAFFRARGISAADQDKCLGDVAAAEALANGTSKATNDKNVTGTPTFFINDELWSVPATTSPVAPQLVARLSALSGS